MRRLPALILLLLATVAARAQKPLPVEFLQAPARNTQISAFVHNSVTYGSLNDLGHIFNITLTSNPQAGKVEARNDQFTLRITMNNAFVVIVDRKENANLIQLPTNVLYRAGSFYVPIGGFVPLLKTMLSEEIAFDGLKMTVGRRRPRSVYDVSGISFDEKSNGYLVRIMCERKLPDYESWLKPVGDDTWLYITIANARANVNAINSTKPPAFVRKLMVFQSPASIQITLKLKGAVSSTELVPAENSNDILVAIHTPTEEQLASRRARDYERTLQRERDKWKLDVVVIDAGHGGDDPGTIGPGRVKEKDITLGIALKLGKLIEKNLKDVKVVYTRKTDTFVELYRRGQIANQMGGKLFISIHCNAMPRKRNATHGFEIYLLRPGKTENALRIAERENDVIKMEPGYQNRYQQLTDENFILLTMAQSAYVKYSEQFASVLQQEMGKHLELTNNGVKQAGFYVLVGASMPNVLVETAYLSNKHDEKILMSAPGQQKIAEAVFNAVKRYKLEYEKSLTEGRDLGASNK